MRGGRVFVIGGVNEEMGQGLCWLKFANPERSNQLLVTDLCHKQSYLSLTDTTNCYLSLTDTTNCVFCEEYTEF